MFNLLRMILKRAPLLAGIILSWLILTIIAFVCRGRAYLNYAEDYGKHPGVSVVMRGFHDHVLPWSGTPEDRDDGHKAEQDGEGYDPEKAGEMTDERDAAAGAQDSGEGTQKEDAADPDQKTEPGNNAADKNAADKNEADKNAADKDAADKNTAGKDAADKNTKSEESGEDQKDSGTQDQNSAEDRGGEKTQDSKQKEDSSPGEDASLKGDKSQENGDSQEKDDSGAAGDPQVKEQSAEAGKETGKDSDGGKKSSSDKNDAGNKDGSRDGEGTEKKDPADVPVIPETSGSRVAPAKDYGVADSEYLSPKGTVFNTDTEGLFAPGKVFYSFQEVGDKYFEDALFIGDSRTVGLFEYGGMAPHTSFLARESTTVYDLFDNREKMDYTPRGKKTMERTLEDLLSKAKFRKIYLSVGVNELGIPDTLDYYKEYRKVLERINKLQPDAIIYIQGIMHVSKSRSSSDPVFNNTAIVQRNTAISTLANGRSIFYIDMNEELCDKDGNLKDELTGDGIHLKASACSLWYDYLKKHAIVVPD